MLMRMFGPKGNPQASNLFAVIGYLQEQEGIHLEVKARKAAEVQCDCIFFGDFQWRSSIISEHGIFHGTLICHQNKSLKMKAKNGMSIIEGGVIGADWKHLALAGICKGRILWFLVN